MYNFLYRPRFYFVNSHILAILSDDYFSASYPRSFFGNFSATAKPVVYYDLWFKSYISSLIHGEKTFFFCKPYTFAYFFFVGLFLRVLWALGSGYRFLPVYARSDDIRVIGFYDLGFTPLAILFKAFYYAKSYFFGFSALHYAFNPYFFFYRRIGQKQISFFSADVYNDLFLTNVIFFTRFSNFFLLFFAAFFGIFFSIPVHFVFRPLFWQALLFSGRFWYLYISIFSSPIFSFERFWLIVQVTPISAGVLTTFFFNGFSAYRFYKSLRLLGLLGLVKPGTYSAQSSFHHRYSIINAQNNVFTIFKFYFVQPSCRAPLHQPYLAPRTERLGGFAHLRRLGNSVYSADSNALENRAVFFSLLRRRSTLLISKQAAVFNTFGAFVTDFFNYLGYFLFIGLKIFSAMAFGPVSEKNLLFSKHAITFKHFFPANNLGGLSRPYSPFFSYFGLRYLISFFSDIFSNFFARMRIRAALQIEYAYFDQLRKLFRKLNYFPTYSSYFHDHDAEVLSSHRSTLDSADIDPEDFYDTDLAEGDDLDASFPSEDFSETLGAFDFTVPTNSGVYDAKIPENFFQTSDSYVAETNLAKVFLAQTLVPNFYEFYRRKQYEHIDEEFWFHNHDWHEDPNYESEDLPTDYETASPDSAAASRLVTWGNAYRRALNQRYSSRLSQLPLTDFTRAPGIVFGGQQLNKLSRADWAELTLFVEAISGATPKARTTAVHLTATKCQEIWEIFATRCKVNPDLVLKRILSAKHVPGVFKNILIYPHSEAHARGPLTRVIFRFLFGLNFSQHKIFKFYAKVFISVGFFDERYFSALTGTPEILATLALYFDGYLSEIEFSRTLSSTVKTRYQILLISAYLRRLAVDDFETFRAKAQSLKDPLVVTILLTHQKYKHKFEEPTISFNQPLTLLQAFFAFLHEPNVKTFSDYFYRFWVRRPQSHLLRTLTGDEIASERFKIEPSHPRANLTPYLFIVDFFTTLFSRQKAKNLFTSEWALKNDLPAAVGAFPRADDVSVYSPDLRAPAYTLNPFPNEVEGWLGLTPFLSAVQNSFYDPHVIELALPSQLNWLGLEDTYRWDTETDLEQLDIYDEYLDVTAEYWLDDEDDVAPNGPFEGQVTEDDIDSLSLDPDVTELGYDLMGEGATYEDLYQLDEEPWDNEYASETHIAYYATDREELAVENYGEDEWALEEFNLFTDASIPLSRLFFGGLRIPQTFPATDPRIFLGAFSETSVDTSLHFTNNFGLAQRNADTLSLALSSRGSDTSRNMNSLFFWNPLTAVAVKISLYTYLFFKHLIYTYIFFDFQTRPDVLKLTLHFRAINHYFRWSSFYGNKYYFSKFSESLAAWLRDFENYTEKQNQISGTDTFQLFGYFKPFTSVTRLLPFTRFFSSLPLISFWHSTDASSFNLSDEAGATTVSYDHVDKWSLYERQRFTTLLDLPMYSAITDKCADEEEGAFLDLAPHVDDDNFSDYDDSLLFNFSMEEGIYSHHEEFANRIELFYAAYRDFFDIVRDYTLYASRLFIRYYVFGPFQYWVTFSDTFWLKLAIRLGFWVNILRYFLAISVYFIAVTYFMLVLPRFVYYVLGDYFSTSILLFVNGLLAMTALIGLAFITFNPAYHFFSTLTKFERAALAYLLFFIYSQHVFYGYLRAGTSNVARLDTMEGHADTQRTRRELNYDTAYERSHTHLNKGFVAHKNLETVGEYVPIDLERLIYDARSRQKIFWRGRSAWPDTVKRSQHFEFSYSSAPLSFANFFYAVKSNVLKIRTRVFTGYRYIRHFRMRTMDTAQRAELHEIAHRYEGFNVGTYNKLAQEWLIQKNFQRVVDGFQTRPLYSTKAVTGTGRRSARTTRKNYFSPRHRSYLKRTWTPFAYDFRVKSLDHNPEVYSSDLAFTKKFEFKYNRFGSSPRQRNELVRIPIWQELFMQDDAEPVEEPADLFPARGRFNKRDRAIKAGYRNDNSDDVFNNTVDATFFAPRRKQPKMFYNKNFNVYSYGDWHHRRLLLNKAYTFKRVSSSSLVDLGQYYYFIRGRSKNAHFSDLYAKNLRDYVLQTKPNRAYTIANIYGPTGESEHLTKFVDGPLLSYHQDHRSLNAFSQNRPYDTWYNKFAQMYPNSNFVSKDRSDTYRHLQKYYNKKSSNQSTWYHPFHFYTTDLYFKLFGRQTHVPDKLVLSRAERAQFLAIARALRSVRQHNRILHMTKSFSDFHFYKSIVPAAQYPRDALSLYLSFENSRSPQVTRVASPLTTDPYYRARSGRSSNLFPDAFISPALPYTLNGPTGHPLTPSYARRTKRDYDPVNLYDLPPKYPLYNFAGTGLTDTDLKFSFIFDNPDVYDDEDDEEFAAFNRSKNIHAFPARGVADYEDYLDDYLQRRPHPKFRIVPGPEMDLFTQFAYQRKLYMSLDLFEQLPQVYDPFKIRKYKDARSARRFTVKRGSFMVGEARKHRPGRFRNSKGRARRFSQFTDQLAAISDYNRTKSLDKVYFSEFEKFSKISSPDAMLTAQAQYPRAPFRRKDNLLKFFNDDTYYQERWSLSNRALRTKLDSLPSVKGAAYSSVIEDFDEMEILDNGADYKAIRKQAGRKAAIINTGIQDFGASTLAKTDPRPPVERAQQNAITGAVDLELANNLDNVIATRERKRYEARLARERLRAKSKDLGFRLL